MSSILRIIYCTHLHVGPYLIVAVKRRPVGSIDGSMVYEVIETDIIPFTKTTIHLSEPQVKTSRFCVFSVMLMGLKVGAGLVMLSLVCYY